jgi:hypothetical protein
MKFLNTILVAALCVARLVTSQDYNEAYEQVAGYNETFDGDDEPMAELTASCPVTDAKCCTTSFLPLPPPPAGQVCSCRKCKDKNGNCWVMPTYPKPYCIMRNNEPGNPQKCWEQIGKRENTLSGIVVWEKKRWHPICNSCWAGVEANPFGCPTTNECATPHIHHLGKCYKLKDKKTGSNIKISKGDCWEKKASIPADWYLLKDVYYVKRDSFFWCQDDQSCYEPKKDCLTRTC